MPGLGLVADGKPPFLVDVLTASAYDIRGRLVLAPCVDIPNAPFSLGASCGGCSLVVAGES